MSSVDAFLFPGQGSQEVGMGRELATESDAARDVFATADEILGVPLSRIAWEGPEEELRLTHNAQPALLVHSIAVLRACEGELPPPSFVAGHSLGEFTAHVAAGTLQFEDALRAVRRRGELMLEAGEREPGAMAAVLGLDDDILDEVCATTAADGGVCVAANFNAPGQVVISGSLAGVEAAGRAATEAGARRVIPLNVSGAFHSPLMEYASRGLSEFLSGLSFADPRVPVVSNVTAGAITDGGSARELLIEQLTAPVRWAASVGFLATRGVSTLWEIGQGRVLCGLARRIDRSLDCHAIQAPADLPGVGDEAEAEV